MVASICCSTGVSVGDGLLLGVSFEAVGDEGVTDPAGVGSLLHAAAPSSRVTITSDRTQRVPVATCMRAAL
jgi:hypothetical protein